MQYNYIIKMHINVAYLQFLLLVYIHTMSVIMRIYLRIRHVQIPLLVRIHLYECNSNLVHAHLRMFTTFVIIRIYLRIPFAYAYRSITYVCSFCLFHYWFIFE